MSQYKYYFKKPKSEIVKDALYWLTVAGAISVAATSPYFISNLTKAFIKNKNRRYQKKKTYDAFYNLHRQGYLDVAKDGHRVRIGLTEKGRKKAGRFQIDSLKINKPKKWDGKWRIIIFDICQTQSLKRNVFRGKLEELGFRAIQKSVWCCPYPCQAEINILRDFLGLNKKDIRLIIADSVEEDGYLKKAFGIN